MNYIKTVFFSLLWILSLQLRAQREPATAVIDCYIGDARPDDSLRLQVWYENLSSRGFRDIPSRWFISANKKGSFRFTVDSLSHPVYFSLSKDRNTVISGYCTFISNCLLEPGDDIHIRFDSLPPVHTHFFEFKEDVLMGYRFVHPVFSGRGSAKTAFEFQLDSATMHWIQKNVSQQGPLLPDKPGPAYYAMLPALLEKGLRTNEDILEFQLRLLDSYKTKMSPTAWQIIKVNVIGSRESIAISQFAGLRNAPWHDSTVSDDYKKAFEDSLRRIYDNRTSVDISAIPENLLLYSTGYIGYIADQASSLQKDKYFWLVQRYKGVLRDRLITDFLLKSMFYTKNSNEIITDAVTIVKDPFCTPIVTKLYNTQSIGKEAYNFSLPDQDGKTVQLSDFKGKIVFIDLWYTGCGACAGFYKYQLSRVETHYKNNPNVVFITISIDTNRERWLKSLMEKTYSTPDEANVVNLYTAGQGTDHPLISTYNVRGYPHPFMIDRQGKIYRINNLQTYAEELIPIIDEAIAKK